MIRRKVLLLGIVIMLVILVGVTNTHATNLIANGSFEQGDWWGNESWFRVLPGWTYMTGWTVGGAGIDWHNSYEMVPENGQYVVDLNLDGFGLGDTGTISQSFATIPGAHYMLTFYMANPYPYPAGTPLLNVNLNGINFAFNAQLWNGWTDAWVQENVAFVANGSATTLTFSSLDGDGYWGGVIDNVSVSAVPEPSTLALVAAAFTGILSAIGRHRQEEG